MGNALVLILRDDPDNPSEGIRTAEAGPGDDSALLHIEFGEGQGGSGTIRYEVWEDWIRRNLQQQGYIFENTSTPFCPPKPKLFDMAALTFFSRASLGTTSRSHSGSFVS